MKIVYVSFVSSKLKGEFESLKSGTFEDKKLYDFIDSAVKDLKQNPSCGIKVPKKLWPKI